MSVHAPRYRVERQFRRPPPAPYSNPWEMVAQLFEEEYAHEYVRDAQRDDESNGCGNTYVYRIIDREE